ncbi:sigma-54-dependent Fis family transcriptional regulator [bacterium]|nr:sigma-54-dependent Fis family transcriptional regulator [bacterium]
MNERTELLIIDDEVPQQKILKVCFEKRGFAVRTAGSGEEGVALFAQHRPPIVITDLRMGGMSGLDVLKEVKKQAPGTEVILITAYGDVDVAVDALKSGAADFIMKPVDLGNLVQIVRNAVERQAVMAAPRQAPPAAREPGVGPIVTRNQGMAALLESARCAAQSDATILIRGESGTGKELLARAIQQQSRRAARPFVAVNCAALNENLLESELFGHCKGSFTGAIQDRIGRFEEADGGTIFLDEIGDLPLGTQVKLLRVLQEGEIQRVGENRTRTVDVRVIAATNQELERMMAGRTFRQDLYYRFNVISFRLPPLRDRRDDIPLLAGHFLELYAARAGRPAPAISPRALESLAHHSFPGNIRELENIIQRTLVMTPGAVIDDVIIHADLGVPPVEDIAAPGGALGEDAGLDDMLAGIERREIEKALREAGNNQSEAARRLGITERQLRYRRAQLGIR